MSDRSGSTLRNLPRVELNWRAQLHQRTPVSRPKILKAALRYIDMHGLAALRMHKVGAELGVKGMYLYNHVANKEDVLEGLVELLWSEVEETARVTGDGRDGVRSLAHATRDMAHRHPRAAPLITSQSIMPSSALWLVRVHVAALVSHGIPDEDAYALLRTVTSYTLGTAFNEVTWGNGQPRQSATYCAPGTAGDLAGVAEIFCGQYNPGAQFEHGLDLVIRGFGGRVAPTADDAR